MVFFSATTDQNNRTRMNVSREIWLYPLVTIPLTFLVMGVWLVWRKQRGEKKGIYSNTREPKPESLSEKT